jgi:hypothetical protein
VHDPRLAADPLVVSLAKGLTNVHFERYRAAEDFQLFNGLIRAGRPLVSFSDTRLALFVIAQLRGCKPISLARPWLVWNGTVSGAPTLLFLQ